MSGIRFSIVIACYNQEAFIRESVESALSQDHPDKEIIVVDDCSSDGTADILKAFGESINLAMFPQNSGVYASRNHGASLARGEYLVFLDGDDVLMPWALDVYDRLVKAHCPKLMLGKPVRFHGKVPNTNVRDIPKSIQFVEYPSFLAKDRSAIYNTSALVVDRPYFLSAGGWTQGIFFQDIQDLLAKLGSTGKMIFVLDPGTVWYRMHAANAIHKIPSFVDGIRVLMANATAGKYPGDRKCQAQRFAWFGGLSFYWAKEAIRNGHFRCGIKLLALSWWMILLALYRRGIAWLWGRKPTESLPFDK